MKLLTVQILVALVLATPVANAQNMMSEDEALKNFKEAAKMYRQNSGELEAEANEGEGTSEPLTAEYVLEDDDVEQGAEAMSDKELLEDDEIAEEDLDTEAVDTIDQEDIDGFDDSALDTYAPIEDIVVAVNLENKTLDQVVQYIVNQARDEAGEWDVKWRVKPENSYILSERVNLIAETNLSEFMTYLVDRVNNMTGIQLFVTVFDKSRIIVISDTYYWWKT